MIPRRLRDIEAANIQQLLDQGVPESLTLDYKAVPHDLKTDKGKRELVKDVAAFANAYGGDLVLGVSESKKGTPTKILGCGGVNVDVLVSDIVKLVRAKLAPPVTDIDFKAVQGFEAGPVIVVRVGASQMAPHMITMTHRQNEDFVMRTGTNNNPMEVMEIRSSFLRGDDLMEQSRRFRSDRLERLQRGEGCLPFEFSSLGVVHVQPVVPLTSVGRGLLDMKEAQNTVPSMMDGRPGRLNFEGLICGSVERDGSGAAADVGYTQLFRDGRTEIVKGPVTHLRNNQYVFPLDDYMADFAKRAQLSVQVLERLDVPPPYVIGFSVLGIARSIPYDRINQYHLVAQPIVRDTIVAPEVVFDPMAAGTLFEAVRPALDIVWQSFGQARCRLYNADGNWSLRG